MFSKRLLITLISGSLLLAGTLIAIQFAKGYRFSRQGILQGTGLLAANSFPNGAQVYVNGKLSTATDNTLNLDPGEYDVEIKKDGFASWKKHVNIEKELVVQTAATLFPSSPSLTPLTFTGAQNIVPSPDGQKVVFYVSSASIATKNGLYVLELTDNFLSLQKGPKLIAQAATGFDLTKATLVWSPDSAQLLLSFDGKNILLDPTKENIIAELQDITYRLPRLFEYWLAELKKRSATRLTKFPKEMQMIASQSASFVISPDDERVLYTAQAPATLSNQLVAPVPAASTQTQERQLTVGGIYVYDRKEDRNFRVGTNTQIAENTQLPFPTPQKKPGIVIQAKAKTTTPFPAVGKTSGETLQNFVKYYAEAYAGSLYWFPDSRHLIGIKENAIIIKEYDNTNEIALYTGPFDGTFVFPWPNGSKIIFTTNFNQGEGKTVDLYAMSLK